MAPTDVDEQPLPGESARALARRLAEEKAHSAADPALGEVVVAADTIVELDELPLGKPADMADARRMLLMLRGRPHRVITAVAIRGQDAAYSETVETPVEMRAYSVSEMERYLDSGQALDKAGAYAIQDSEFAPASLAGGCSLNAVGLPLCAVARGLQQLGCLPPDEEYQPPKCRLCQLGIQALAELDGRLPVGLITDDLALQ